MGRRGLAFGLALMLPDATQARMLAATSARIFFNQDHLFERVSQHIQWLACLGSPSV